MHSQVNTGADRRGADGQFGAATLRAPTTRRSAGDLAARLLTAAAVGCLRVGVVNRSDIHSR